MHALRPLQRYADPELEREESSFDPSPGKVTLTSRLPRTFQQRMERSFGADFSDVEIHQGDEARAVGALAFARGRELHFAPGRFDPDSRGGQVLIAHELAHLVQQGQGRVAASGVVDDAGLEREADVLAERAVAGETIASGGATSASAGDAVQRKPDPAAEPGECPTGPSPAPAAPSRSGPTPANPRSGFDWDGFWEDNGGNITRGVFEVTRILPVIGGGLGACADLIEMYQNTTTAQETGDLFLVMSTSLTSVIVLANNFVGHLAYCGELAQDGAVVSIVGIELTPFTVPLNATLLGAKSTLQLAQVCMDLVNLTAAEEGLKSAGLSDQQREAYDALAGNFQMAGILDTIGLIGDLMDLSTVGVANMQVVGEVYGCASETIAFGKIFYDNFGDVLAGWMGIWGSDLVDAGATQRKADPDAAQPAGLSAAAAAPIILDELGRIEAAYGIGDRMVGFVDDAIVAVKQELTAEIQELTGQRDPLLAFRDLFVQATRDVERRIADLTGLLGTSADLEARLAEASASLDQLEASLAEMAMPTIAPAAPTDLGNNPVADAGEAVVDAGKAAIGAAAQAALDRLQPALDQAKQLGAAAIAEARATLAQVGGMVESFRANCEEQLAYAEGILGGIAENLAAAENVEQAVDGVLAVFGEALGMDGELGLDDFRAMWADCQAKIAGAMAWANGLR